MMAPALWVMVVPRRLMNIPGGAPGSYSSPVTVNAAVVLPKDTPPPKGTPSPFPSTHPVGLIRSKAVVGRFRAPPAPGAPPILVGTVAVTGWIVTKPGLA